MASSISQQQREHCHLEWATSYSSTMQELQHLETPLMFPVPLNGEGLSSLKAVFPPFLLRTVESTGVKIGGTSGKEFTCQCRRNRNTEIHVKKIPQSRKWQLTPLLLHGKFHGQRSLVGDSPRGCKELDVIICSTFDIY